MRIMIKINLDIIPHVLVHAECTKADQETCLSDNVFDTLQAYAVQVIT